MSQPHFHPSAGRRLAAIALLFFAGACAPQPAGPPAALVTQDRVETGATATGTPPPVGRLAHSREDDKTTGAGSTGSLDDHAAAAGSAASRDERPAGPAIPAVPPPTGHRNEQRAEKAAGQALARSAMPAPADGAATSARMAPSAEMHRMPREYATADMAMAPMPMASRPDSNERYQHNADNPLKLVAEDPVSTFSLDVDTGSYSNVRRFLTQGTLPPEDAVRVEELLNYFPYDYPRARGEHPFGVATDLAPCPWQKDHWLLRVAVRADEVDARAMPPANLVFLVDVSGSMDDPAKLPLLRSSLKLLTEQLRAEDRVSLVVYAGREALVLEPTPGDQRGRITRAIDQLEAGGSTAGEAGIRLAYRMAREAFLEGGINRVLLATDGDFNVGVTDFEQLKDIVEHERETGVQLSTLGFGTGNLNDELMEQLADAGNGSYAYIDTLAEGRKVLVDQVRSTLVTVAKDVKVQVEFNPAVVDEYRLIGYENRMLAREDFQNDRVDAGDVGAGQTVTALYELTPKGGAGSVDPLRYGAGAASDGGKSGSSMAGDTASAGSKSGSSASAPRAGEAATAAPAADEVAFVKLRYKRPAETTSRLFEVAVAKSALAPSFEKAGEDFRFAAAVAGFGQMLRGRKYTASWTWDDVLAAAVDSRGRDEFGYRNEFVSLVRSARTLR